MREPLDKMWVPRKFRKMLYEERSKDPSKTFTTIMEEIAEEKRRKKERGGFNPIL